MYNTKYISIRIIKRQIRREDFRMGVPESSNQGSQGPKGEANKIRGRTIVLPLTTVL